MLPSLKFIPPAPFLIYVIIYKKNVKIVTVFIASISLLKVKSKAGPVNFLSKNTKLFGNGKIYGILEEMPNMISSNKNIFKGVLSGVPFLAGVFSVCLAVQSPASAQNHITEFDAVRAAIIEQGNHLPDYIKKAATNNDIRTLERIYELNTSLLTTIESYFRMLKIVVTSEREINKNVVDTLNGWLMFIQKQCMYDIEYLESTLPETKDNIVASQIKTALTNTRKLSDSINNAIKENTDLISGK